MDNDNEKPQTGNHDSDENSHQDDIPEWLQGIDQPNLDDTSPNEPIKENEDTWVKETSQDYTETTQEVTGAEESLTPIKSLPDWLSQLSNIDNEKPSTKELPEDSFSETSEEIDLTDDVVNDPETRDELEVNQENQIDSNDFQDSPPQDSTEDEGFIEISEFDLAEIPEPLPASEDADILEDEELPPWLDEMIIEPDEPIEDEEIFEANLNENKEEPTEPFDVYPEAPPLEEKDIDFPQETDLAAQNLPEEMIRDDSMFSINEGDTEPVITQSVSVDSSEPAQELQETNQDQSDELPKTLMFAKHLLDQSEFQPAKKILNTYVEQKKYVDIINQWLHEIVNQREETNSDVLELIGDIALLNNDPEQALTAYSQAITMLVSRKKDFNESD